MRQFLTYMAAGLLILTYLLSYIGFGIHTCSCSDSRQVILLFNNLSCEKIHAHIHVLGTHEHHPGDGCEDCHEAEHGCPHDHQDGCCHTDIMVLTDDQDDSRQTEFINVAYRTLDFESQMADMAVPAVNFMYHRCHRTGRAWFLQPAPDIPFWNDEALSVLSVWRI